MQFEIQSISSIDTISFTSIYEQSGTIVLSVSSAVANEGCSDSDLEYEYRSFVATSSDSIHQIHVQLVGEEFGNRVYLFIDDYIYSLYDENTLKRQFTNNNTKSQYDWAGQLDYEYSDSNSNKS